MWLRATFLPLGMRACGVKVEAVGGLLLLLKGWKPTPCQSCLTVSVEDAELPTCKRDFFLLSAKPCMDLSHPSCSPKA